MNTREEVLSELRQGRVTPHHLKVNTSAGSKQTAHHHLEQLQEEGHIERVSRGLYELVDDPVASSDGDQR